MHRCASMWLNRPGRGSSSRKLRNGSRMWVMVTMAMVVGFVAVVAFRSQTVDPPRQNKRSVSPPERFSAQQRSAEEGQRARISHPTIQVVVPADLEALEPDVRRLVEQKVAVARDSINDPGAHGELGLTYEANDLWTEARGSYENAARLAVGDPYWNLHLAIALEKSGAFSQSLNVLTSLANEHTSVAAIQQRLGYALLKTGQLDRAQSAFRIVIQITPDSPEGYVGLAETFLQKDQTDEAVKQLKTALSRDQKYKVTYYLLGTAYRRLGRLREAMVHLHRGERAEVRYLKDPLTPRIEALAVSTSSRLNRSVRFMADGKFAQAAVELETVLKTEPSNVTAMNNLAGAYLQTGRRALAHSLLVKALQLNEQNPSTHINLASWHLSSSNLDDALHHAEKAVEFGSWLASSHHVRIQILLRMKRIDDARNAVRQALRDLPYHPQLEQTAARLHLEVNSTERSD